MNVRIHNILWEEVSVALIDGKKVGRNLKYQPFRRVLRRMQLATNNERDAAMLILDTE